MNLLKKAKKARRYTSDTPKEVIIAAAATLTYVAGATLWLMVGSFWTAAVWITFAAWFAWLWRREHLQTIERRQARIEALFYAVLNRTATDPLRGNKEITLNGGKWLPCKKPGDWLVLDNENYLWAVIERQTGFDYPRGPWTVTTPTGTPADGWRRASGKLLVTAARRRLFDSAPLQKP